MLQLLETVWKYKEFQYLRKIALKSMTLVIWIRKDQIKCLAYENQGQKVRWLRAI